MATFVPANELIDCI